MMCQIQSLFVSLELSLLVIFNTIKVSLIHVMWKYTENSKHFIKLILLLTTLIKRLIVTQNSISQLCFGMEVRKKNEYKKNPLISEFSEK